MVKAVTIKNRPFMTARATENFFKVGEVASSGGCVAAPIWPYGALRRSFDEV